MFFLPRLNVINLPFHVETTAPCFSECGLHRMKPNAFPTSPLSVARISYVDCFYSFFYKMSVFICSLSLSAVALELGFLLASSVFLCCFFAFTEEPGAGVSFCICA